MTLKAGDKLHFNCHVTYTDKRAAATGAPTPAANGNLKFANEALSAEMCILFGSTAALHLGEPKDESSKLPSFATAE